MIIWGDSGVLVGGMALVFGGIVGWIIVSSVTVKFTKINRKI